MKVREHLGDKADTYAHFAIALGLRGTDSAGAARVKRWLRGKDAPRGGDPDFEGTICLLDALDAIQWTKVTSVPHRSPEAQVDHIVDQAKQAREQIDKQRPNDQPQQEEEGQNP